MITPQADGSTLLRITENGEIRNVFFRFVSRFFMGYTKTMEEYLNALGEKFGEKTAVGKLDDAGENLYRKCGLLSEITRTAL